MSNWHYIVLGLCLLLLAGLLLTEWRRVVKVRRWWRCVASLVAVVSLACLGLPVSYWQDVVRSTEPTGEPPTANGIRGIMTVDWQQRLNQGEKLYLRGTWTGGAVKLMLMGMGQVVDSVNLPAAAPFTLCVVPSQMGRAVYSLVGLAGKDTVEREDIPVEVVSKEPLRILILAGSPGFENSMLMKWLSGDGHSVASRTQVSREKVQMAFVNREPSVLAPLTAGLLEGFDVVIGDRGALPARGTAEWSALQQQVERRGLELLVKVDSAGLDSMIALMRRRPGRVLLRDSTGKPLAGAVMEGAGKLVFTASGTSYSRLLAGDRMDYAAYWSVLLREGKKKPVEEWYLSPRFPKVGGETVLELQTAEQEPQGNVGGAAVYMEQDAWLPFLWRGKYWPEKPGWLALSGPKGDTVWEYVWRRESWKGMGRGRRQESKGISGGVAKGVAEPVRAEVPKALFWGLFLMATVFLWVERKMGGMNG